MRQRYIRFVNMISLSHADVTRPIINPSHILWGFQSHVMGTQSARYAFTHSHFGILDASYEHPLVLPQFAQR